MIAPLEDKAKDIAFSSGLLEEWVKKEPETIQGHLKTVIEGIDLWRNKYFALAAEYQKLNANYVNLTAQSGKLMIEVQHLKDQNDELLIDQQREFHKERTA